MASDTPDAADAVTGKNIPMPLLDDLQCRVGRYASLRLALNTLEDMPSRWDTDNARQVMRDIREKLEEAELEQIHFLGPREYLLIKPLSPDVGGEFADKAAIHVRALDELGLLIRLD